MRRWSYQKSIMRSPQRGYDFLWGMPAGFVLIIKSIGLLEYLEGVKTNATSRLYSDIQ
jgi:hypothetical protein